MAKNRSLIRLRISWFVILPAVLSLLPFSATFKCISCHIDFKEKDTVAADAPCMHPKNLASMKTTECPYPGGEHLPAADYKCVTNINEKAHKWHPSYVSRFCVAAKLYAAGQCVEGNVNGTDIEGKTCFCDKDFCNDKPVKERSPGSSNGGENSALESLSFLVALHIFGAFLGFI